MRLIQDFQKPETLSNQLFTDQVHFCCLDKKAVDEIRLLILRHSPSRAHGLILFLMQSINWAVSLFLFHLSFFSLSDLVRWSSARKQRSSLFKHCFYSADTLTG
ncbi:hypothetical protein AMECASPLE_039496 [Ameca splendens]|uniref:Uncharacterized protein n=1 Tax=Ameca splendens TaxID=208324 RepID=A0ABV0ZHZ4_9TELE